MIQWYRVPGSHAWVADAPEGKWMIVPCPSDTHYEVWLVKMTHASLIGTAPTAVRAGALCQ